MLISCHRDNGRREREVSKYSKRCDGVKKLRDNKTREMNQRQRVIKGAGSKKSTFSNRGFQVALSVSRGENEMVREDELKFAGIITRRKRFQREVKRSLSSGDLSIFSFCCKP